MRSLRLFPLLLLALAVGACDSSSGVVEADSRVFVAYEGRLQDGTVFDRSSGAQFGLRNVIPGFRDALLGAEIGETRTFDIPPEQAYGADGVVDQAGNVIVPPNATLTFEVTILDIL